MVDAHSISMAASKLSWEDVDKRARSIGFNGRSQYIQYLVEKDINRSRIDEKYITWVLMSITFVMVLLLLLVK